MTGDLFDLTGKVAVVTGGSRGLGRAMVDAFAEHGADVVVASRKTDACRAVAEEVAAKTGRRAVGIGYHAAVWDDADRLVEAVYEELGSCDVLVNNAGMSPLYPSLVDVTEDLFDKVVGVNLKGPFRLSSLIGARMSVAGGGSIINISSIAAVQPGPQSLVYACAKVALHAMTTGLAQAYGPTVRANVIMPGAFYTDVSKHWDMVAVQERAAEIPLRRVGQPSEIIGAALYLASQASSYTSGAVIKVDGGRAFSPG